MDVLAATREDRDAAHHYLTGLRLRDPNYKAPSTLFKSKKTVEKMTNPENFVFSQSEKNRAFDLAIARNEPGGLIAALIEMGAQINVVPEASSNNLNYKKLLGKREEDQRSDALKTVACNRRLDLVRLVACQGVDQDSRDSALLEVTRSMYPDIVRELLFRRANPNAYEGKILESAVSCKKEDIVRMLLQAPVTLDQRYATNSLPVAVKGGDLSIVQSLAEFGADVNHQKGVCLQMVRKPGAQTAC
jgi:ankyrin repeat protein